MPNAESELRVRITRRSFDLANGADQTERLRIKQIMKKYNQREKQPEKPKFMRYNNIQNKNTRVKQFVIEDWEFESKMISNKKTLDRGEREDILEKDAKMLADAPANEVVLDRHRQFSFQKISNFDKFPQNKLGQKGLEKKEIGGLLRALGEARSNRQNRRISSARKHTQWRSPRNSGVFRCKTWSIGCRRK